MGEKNLKELVGRKAAHLVKNGMVIGLGTGSTVFFTIQELGERVKKEGLKFRAIPTSIDSEKKAKAAGIDAIPFEQLNKVEKIHLAIDGADEVDKELNLIKGGGGAHLRYIDEFFKRMTGVETYSADEPLFCVAKGAGLILNHLDVYKRTLLNKR